jgi:hypothetical protein
MGQRNNSRSAKVQFRVLGESQKSRFSREFLIAPFAISPRRFKLTFENHEFLGGNCRFLFSQTKSVELEVKIWTFRARFARENRHFVPLNFSVIAPRRFWAIFASPFRSAIAAPNVFATRTLSMYKYADRGIWNRLSRVWVGNSFIRFTSKIFSLSHWERAGVRVPCSVFAPPDSVSIYLYTLQIRS